MSAYRLALGVVVAILAAWGGALLLLGPAPSHPYFEKRFDVVAHRGGAGLRPENTLAAFEHAVALGADVLDMDVRVTRDGEIVVIHDATVDRTTDGKGSVAELTLAALRELDAGYHWPEYRGKGLRVPALADVFNRQPAMRMNIEMKQFAPASAAALCALIRRSNMAAKVLVGSFSDEPMAAFRAACPEVATALTLSEGRSFAFLLGAYPLPAPAFEVPDRFSFLIPGARARGLKVYVWTVNDESRMRELIDAGVNGVITDRPDVLRRLSPPSSGRPTR